MKTKRLLSSFLLRPAVLFLLAAPVFAQDLRPVVHRLSWQEVEYVSKYEVVVEVLTKTDAWMEVTRRTSEKETFVDCPLSIGSYRFRVAVYDLLGNPASSTEWILFEIRASEEKEEPEKILIEKETVIQVAAEKKPAPEEAEKSVFRLELVFQPLIILPFSDFNEIYATSPVQPLGFALRLAVMPFVTRAGVIGFELSPSWNYMANDILITSRYTHILNGQFSLIWQIRPFSRNSAFTFRLGGGVALIRSRFDFDEGREVTNLGAWNPTASAGLSFISFINKYIYLSGGLDYFNVFSRDNMTMNYLRPSFSLGWWI